MRPFPCFEESVLVRVLLLLILLLLWISEATACPFGADSIEVRDDFAGLTGNVVIVMPDISARDAADALALSPAAEEPSQRLDSDTAAEIVGTAGLEIDATPVWTTLPREPTLDRNLFDDLPTENLSSEIIEQFEIP